MTNRNMFSNKKNEPFLLSPVYKEIMWGGRRLRDDFNKETRLNIIAESWECSTHKDGVSTIATGVHKGNLLSDVLIEHAYYLGLHNCDKKELPILVKLIDAEKDLSVQVHPDDEYAKEFENNSLGKTEMWYVLDARDNTEIIFGFNKDLTKEELASSLFEDNLTKHLQKVNVKKNDVFYIDAGTVHGICAGNLIAEIQQSSNLTYRLYDYDRVDKTGQKRLLHTKKAIDVAKLSSSKEPRQPLRVLRYIKGCASELLCRCQYFQVERMLVNTTLNRNMVNFQTDYTTFKVLLCTEGCGTLLGGSEVINFVKGDCIFVPANSVEIKIHGIAQFLCVGC